MISVTEYVDERQTIELLQKLLRFNTANPPGNEAPAAKFLEEYLQNLDFETRYFESKSQRGSLVARLRGSGGGRSILLNGHLDTGPIGNGWTREPCGGEIVEGKIYGRGSGDMKSGVAAMVGAATAVVKSGMPRKGDLVLMPTADETSGGYLGVGHVIKNMPDLTADMAIICEPTFGKVGVAHRGVAWVELTVTGKSGQASRPLTGVNAITAMGKVLIDLETTLSARFANVSHPFLPGPNINVGTIEGGVKANVIPDTCRALIDRRLLPGETAEDVLKEINEIAELSLKDTKATFTTSCVLTVAASETPPESEVVKECQKAMETIAGEPGELYGVAGFTDAHFFCLDLGIPTVNFGPWYLHPPTGSITDYPDEFNYVDDVITGTRVYAQLIANIVC